MNRITDKMPGLLNASASGDKAVLGDYVKRLKSMRAKNAGGSFEYVTKTMKIQVDIGNWRSRYEYSVNNGFSAKGTTVEGVIHHEYGHAFSVPSIADISQVTLKLEGCVWKVLERDFGVIRGDTRSKDRLIKKEIGEYATTNYRETFAESFATVVANGRQASKLAVGIIEEWIKTLSPEKQKIFSDLLK
jgi:hypothetical protein